MAEHIFLLARQAESGALEIHSTGMIEIVSCYLCREQTDSSLQISFILGWPFAGVRGSSKSKGSLSRQRILRSLL